MQDNSELAALGKELTIKICVRRNVWHVKKLKVIR